MHDESDVGRWLLLLRDGSETEQQLARTELGLILEARGLHDEAAEAYARNVEDGTTDRRPYERLAALARQRGDVQAEAQALRALAEMLSPMPPPAPTPKPREDLTPPAPLGDLTPPAPLSGAERGEIREIDIAPEEQAQKANEETSGGNAVSERGLVLADDDAEEESATDETPAVADADEVADDAPATVGGAQGDADAAADDLAAHEDDNDRPVTGDQLGRADASGPQEVNDVVVGQSPHIHPQSGDAPSPEGDAQISGDDVAPLDADVSSRARMQVLSGSTGLGDEGTPAHPDDADESPIADVQSEGTPLADTGGDTLPDDTPVAHATDTEPATPEPDGTPAVAALAGTPTPAAPVSPLSAPETGAEGAVGIKEPHGGMWRSFDGAGDRPQDANASPERSRTQPALFRLLATLTGLAVVVVVVVGALMVPVSRPLSVAPAKPAASPTAAEQQLLAATVPTALPSPSPSPSPTAPAVQAPAPSPTRPAVSLAARCTDATLRFPESRDSAGAVRAAYREYLARQGVTADPASTLFAGVAAAHADRHAEVLAGWMAVTLQRERRGLPTFPLVDYVASDIIVAAGPGEYQLRATISPQGWNELRALPPDSCEGAFLASPENARWVDVMQASVGDITWALPTPQPRR